MIPVKAFSGGKKSGRKARPINPKAEKISDVTMLTR